MSIFLRLSCLKEKQLSDEELNRTCAKVDKAIEKVRRLAIKAIDIFPSSSKANKHLHELLKICIDCLQSVLSEPVSACYLIRH